jgi:hypothetical protein
MDGRTFLKRQHLSQPLRSLLIAGLLLLATPFIGTATESKICCYLHSCGEESHLSLWRLEVYDDRSLLYSSTKAEEHFNLLTPQWASKSWRLVNEAEKTRIKVERVGDQLLIKGLFQGEEISRSEAIDSAPWYQAHSVGLRNLLNSDGKTLEFWTVRPDNLSVRRLRAQRHSMGKLPIAGEPQQAMRIRVTAVGVPSWIWHGDYWLRPQDGVLLQYSGRNGLLGAPPLKISLQGPDQTNSCHELFDLGQPGQRW